MGTQGFFAFDILKVLAMMTSLQNFVLSGVQGLLQLMLMESKLFDKPYQAAKHG